MSDRPKDATSDGARQHRAGTGSLRRLVVGGVAVVSIGALVAAGGVAAASQGRPARKVVTLTPPGTKRVAKVTWANFTQATTLDPLFDFEPGSMVPTALMCETLLAQAPTGRLEPGLATVTNPTPTTTLLKLRHGVTFWNGRPLTAADVVYDLQRETDKKLGGVFYTYFDTITSISAPTSMTVKITTSHPTAWLTDMLAGDPGMVVTKTYIIKEGKKFGTPSGGTMCTGAYKLKSWSPGVDMVAVANKHYWNHAVKPLVTEIDIKLISTVSSLTSALLTGSVQGTFTFQGTARELQALDNSSAVEQFVGGSQMVDSLAISSLHGPLGNVNVRRALSLAVNREALVKSTFGDTAEVPQWYTNTSMFDYGRATFERALKHAPKLRQTVAAAKKLLKKAHAVGKSITIGMTDEEQQIASSAQAVKAAGAAIGLNVKFKVFPGATYNEIYATAGLRKGITGFLLFAFPTFSAPTGLLSMWELPGGANNFDTFKTAKLISMLDQARQTLTDAKRVQLNLKIEKQTENVVPYIPLVQKLTVTSLSKSLTGTVTSFAYLWSPWGNHLGGK